MKREETQQTPIVIPEPVYWFPLTTNANDVMGNFPGWSYTGGVTYSDSGAYFNRSAQIYNYNLNIVNSNFQTFSFKVMITSVYSSGIYTMYNLDIGNANTGVGALIAPDWGGNFVSNPYYNGSYDTGLSQPQFPWVANQYFTFTYRQDFSSKMELFVDGVLKGTANISIPSTVVMKRLSLGTHPNNSSRKFLGYIKDFKAWNIILTDEQIAAL